MRSPKKDKQICVSCGKDYLAKEEAPVKKEDNKSKLAVVEEVKEEPKPVDEALERLEQEK